jgi:hypothetical protein
VRLKREGVVEKLVVPGDEIAQHRNEDESTVKVEHETTALCHTQPDHREPHVANEAI